MREEGGRAILFGNWPVLGGSFGFCGSVVILVNKVCHSCSPEG